jgi:GNAT superfamily N-acetyltransferase
MSTTGTGTGTGTELVVREYTDEDEDGVLALLASTLGWVPDGHHRELFRWKHRANPFGRSRAWVAVAPGRGDDGGDGRGQVVGFRSFLRWEFQGPGLPGGVVSAVRAVDTATHPDHQGRGIFSRLTRHGVEALLEDGVGFVFNTPNDQSRPGYLKMGWQDVGRLPVGVRPRSLGGAWRMARARTPAELWSTPCDAGVPVSEALADTAGVAALLGSLRAPGPVSGEGLTTRRTVEHLRWRYGGFPALGYRAHLVGAGGAEGLVLYRLRRRGPALEAAVVEVLLPGDSSRRAARAALRDALRRSGADYAITIGTPPGTRTLPNQGPRLTWRALASTTPPPLAAWHLALGDVELF